jgi:hypothetical protein
MSTTPQTQSATADLVDALAELENVSANKTVKANFTARYVSLDVLLDAIKPVLKRHRLALRQFITTDEQKVGVTTIFQHKDGTVFEAGRLMLKAEGLNAQQVGSLVTYARRITASTAAGISVDTDDDGSLASGVRSAVISSTAPAFSPTPRPLTK